MCLTCSQDSRSFVFNISHDNSAVVLAYGDDDTTDIGVDVMKVELPKSETRASFIEVLNDQVRPTALWSRLCLWIPYS
jgi:phosphopantetheinyl transferase